MKRPPGIQSATAAVSLGVVLLVGCGSDLNAESSCKDFLNAARDDQDAAVSRLARELPAPNAVTPYGRPNVSFFCALNPKKKLGTAVRRSGGESSGRSSGTATGSSREILDTERIERAIERRVLDTRHLRTDVSCPSGIEQKTDVTFNCTAVYGGGRTTFRVTQTDSVGSVRYTGLRDAGG